MCSDRRSQKEYEPCRCVLNRLKSTDEIGWKSNQRIPYSVKVFDDVRLEKFVNSSLRRVRLTQTFKYNFGVFNNKNTDLLLSSLVACSDRGNRRFSLSFFSREATVLS